MPFAKRAGDVGASAAWLVWLQRVVLGAAVVWGLITLMSVPFLFLGGSGGLLTDTALLANGFVFLPAALLSFWFRRVGCVLLGGNAVWMLLAFFFGNLVIPGHGSTTLHFLVGAVSVALFVLTVEVLRWPGPLAGSRRTVAGS